MAGLKDRFPSIVEEVRGHGLIMGIQVKPPVADVVKAVISERLLVVGAASNTVRVLPPLNVTEEELSDATERLGRAFTSLDQAISS